MDTIIVASDCNVNGKDCQLQSAIPLEDQTGARNGALFPTKKPKRNKRPRATRIAERDNVMADRLEHLDKEYGSHRAKVEAKLLRRCAAPWNRSIMHGLVDRYGEEFDGIGPLAHCQSQWCEACQPFIIRKNRRAVRDGVACLNQNKDHIVQRFLKKHHAKGLDKHPNIRWRFITLTFPSLLGRSLETGLKIANRSWNILGKKTICVKTVIGGCKAVEWTFGEAYKEQNRLWSIETDGYHVHIHALVYCLYIDAKVLRPAWTDAVLKACEEFGIDLTISTPTGHCWINIVVVHPNNEKCQRKGITTLDGAMGEVCKYVTKPQTWLDLPDQEILAALEIRPWPRRFEVFGAMRGFRSGAADSSDGRIFNRQSLSSELLAGEAAKGSGLGRSKGERSLSLRQLAQTMPYEKWDALAESYFERVGRYRKFDILMKNPEVELEMLDGEILTVEGLESPAPI